MTFIILVLTSTHFSTYLFNNVFLVSSWSLNG